MLSLVSVKNIYFYICIFYITDQMVPMIGDRVERISCTLNGFGQIVSKDLFLG